jgi:hypothetical protein
MEPERDWFEFDAEMDGEQIPVPAIYRDKCKGKMKIIAFPVREIDKEWEGKKKFTPAFLVDTTGFKFNREEANER